MNFLLKTFKKHLEKAKKRSFFAAALEGKKQKERRSL
jgi:hypothetical protein